MDKEMGNQKRKSAEERISAAVLQCAHTVGLDNINCTLVGELAGGTEASIRTYIQGQAGLVNLAVSEAIATRTYPLVALRGLLRNVQAAQVLDEETKRSIWRAAEAEFFKPAG